MTKLFYIIIAISSFTPLLVRAGVGDNYICLSSQYTQIKFDGEIERYSQIKFEFLWDSPKDNPDEQILWFPEHPRLIASETLYLVEKLPEYALNAEEMINFNQFNPSIVDDTGGLFMQGKLVLTFIGVNGIYSLVANCEKTFR